MYRHLFYCGSRCANALWAVVTTGASPLQIDKVGLAKPPTPPPTTPTSYSLYAPHPSIDEDLCFGQPPLCRRNRERVAARGAQKKPLPSAPRRPGEAQAVAAAPAQRAPPRPRTPRPRTALPLTHSPGQLPLPATPRPPAYTRSSRTTMAAARWRRWAGSSGPRATSTSR